MGAESIIYNKDKTITVNPNVLNIKLSDDITYKNFTGVNNPIKIIDGATEKIKVTCLILSYLKGL